LHAQHRRQNTMLSHHELGRLQKLQAELPGERYQKLLTTFNKKKNRESFRIFTNGWKERQLLHILADQMGLFSRKQLTTLTLDDMHVFCKKCWVQHKLDPKYTEDVCGHDPMFHPLKAEERVNASCHRPFLGKGLCCMLHNGSCPKCKCECDKCCAAGDVSVFNGYVEFSKTKLKLGRRKRRRRNRWKRGLVG